jgi:hypothetical protein
MLNEDGTTNNNWQTTHDTQMTNNHMTNDGDGDRDGNPNTTNEQDNDTLPSLQM